MDFYLNELLLPQALKGDIDGLIPLASELHSSQSPSKIVADRSLLRRI